MTSVVIRLAGEPKGKGRPRFARASGRAYTPAPTRNYEAALRYAAQETMRDRPLLSGPLEVFISAQFAIPKSFPKKKRLDALVGAVRPTVKPDLDNIVKCLDALEGVVFTDDKQIVNAIVQKHYAEKPELEISISELGNPQ